MSGLLITSLRVRGYHRFNLNPLLKEFTYSPNKPVQVILGTNSSGKSSLAELLLLYPVDHTELDDDGYVYIKLLYNDLPYELSVYKEGLVPKYEFRIDGDNLNDTYKVTVQRNLVKQHFGITSEVRDLLMGRTTFTHMTAATRRKWLIELSGVDYDFIMTLFNTVQREARDLSAVNKHLTERVASESEALSNSDVDGLLMKRNKLQGRLQEKLRAYDPNMTRESESGQKNRIDGLSEALEKEMERTPSLRSKLNRQAGVMRHTLQHKDAEEVKFRLSEKQALSKRQIDEINIRLEKLYLSDPSVRLDSLPTEGVLLRMREVLLRKVERDSNNEYPFGIGYTYDTLIEFNSCRETVEQIAMDHKATGDETFNDDIRLRMEQELNDLHALMQPIDKDDYELQEAILKQVSLAEVDSTNCPSCHHSWKRGYDAEEHERLLNLHTDVLKRKVELKKNISDYEAKFEVFNYQLNNLKLFYNVTQLYPSLVKFWAIMRKHLRTNPKAIIGDWRALHEEILMDKGRQEDMETLKSLDNKLSLYKEIRNTKQDGVKEEITSLEAELHDLVKAINYTEGQITGTLKFQHLVSEIRKNLTSVDVLHEDMTERLKVIAKSAHQKDVDIEINQLKHDITALDLEISSLESSRVNLKELYRQLEDNGENLRVTKELLRKLSPTVGFIGVTLGGFLQTFIQDINRYLDHIWEYPLEVSKPVDKNGMLDPKYRFPLIVNNGKPKPDVRNGSDAVLKIINLAFLMSVRERLNLSFMPLVMDEVGAAMDDTHSLNMYNDINTSIIQHTGSQCFVISHDPQLRSVFDDDKTEYLVLDSRNIDVSSLTENFNNNLELF